MALKKKIGKLPTKKPIGEKEVKNFMSEEDLENLSLEYDRLSEQIKALETKKKEVGSLLKEVAQKQGKEDEKGSFYIKSSTHIIGKVHKQQYTINHEKGYEFCKEHDLMDCISQVTTYQVDENAITQAISDERVKLKDVEEGIYDYKDSYSISVKLREKEDMPEIEVSSLKK